MSKYKYAGRCGGIALACLAFSGCGFMPEKKDEGDKKDGSAKAVLNMPDGYADIAVKCYKGNGVYSSTGDGQPVIIPRDKACK